MKTLLMGITLIGVAASPVLANECPTLQVQIDNEVQRRLDDGAYQAKVIAAQAAQLHADGKHAESVAKYEEAAKAAGITLQHKQ